MQCTVLNGTPSDGAKVTAGIPRGSVLGPTLFTLYRSDLPGAISLQRFICTQMAQQSVALVIQWVRLY